MAMAIILAITSMVNALASGFPIAFVMVVWVIPVGMAMLLNRIVDYLAQRHR